MEKAAKAAKEEKEEKLEEELKIRRLPNPDLIRLVYRYEDHVDLFIQ